MTTINERIRLILDRGKIQNKDVASVLGMTNSRLSQKFKEGIWDSVAELQKISNLTGYSLDWLITGGGDDGAPKHNSLISEVKEPSPSYNEYLKGKIIRPITVTVNQQGKELMSYVNVKAQAGYMKGYGDPHYVERLPAFNLPIMKEGSYRMFEVDGDSMLQIGGGGLHNGDIVISQYVEDIFSIRDNRVYVVISTEGVCVKRCINRLKDNDNPVLILNSDNKNGQHPAIVLRPHQIVEVWELKAFISRQLSFATDLWEVINDLQVKQALLNEKVNGIADKMLNP